MTQSSRSAFIFGLLVLGAVLLLLFPEAVSAQCSLCAQALEKSGKQGLINGFKWSIAFMVTPPTLMTAGVFFLAIRSNRNRKQMQTTDDASVHPIDDVSNLGS